MSCYEMNKVLRVPVSSLDMREFWNGVKSRFDRTPEDELEEDFRWYASETYPNAWSESAEAGKSSFPLTEDQLFKEYVDAYMADGCGDSSVLITLSGKSIGARQAVQVASISEGFDWESNQIRIEPQHPVVKKTDFRDKPWEIKVCMSKSSRPKYMCPNCNGPVSKNDYFCRHCGQRLKFTPPKALKYGK